MPSGPVAFVSSKLDNNAATSPSEIIIEFKDPEKGDSTRVSRLGGLSLLLKTDAKKLLKELALSTDE